MDDQELKPSRALIGGKSATRTPYIRMDGTRRPSVIALDVSFRDPEYSRFLREKPGMEWNEWRQNQLQKARSARKAPENAFGAPLKLAGTPEMKRHNGAYSRAKGAVPAGDHHA